MSSSILPLHLKYHKKHQNINSNKDKYSHNIANKKTFIQWQHRKEEEEEKSLRRTQIVKFSQELQWGWGGGGGKKEEISKVYFLLLSLKLFCCILFLFDFHAVGNNQIKTEEFIRSRKLRQIVEGAFNVIAINDNNLSDEWGFE